MESRRRRARPGLRALAARGGRSQSRLFMAGPTPGRRRYSMADVHQDQDRWTRDGLYYEYSKAANPIAEGLTSPVPMADFPRHLHESGPTRIIPFDLSHELKCPGPATSPAL